MMTGPALIKDKIVNYLKADLPDRIVKYRNFWNLDSKLLPMPNQKSYFTFAPPSLEYMIDQLPALYTVIISTSNLNRYGYSDEYDPLYGMEYQARTYVWVETKHVDEMAACGRARDSLMTVVRSSLLDHQAFLSHDDGKFCEVLFDEGSITEEYADIEATKGDWFCSGGYVAYTLTVTEINTRENIGVATDFQTEVIPAYLLED